MAASPAVSMLNWRRVPRGTIRTSPARVRTLRCCDTAGRLTRRPLARAPTGRGPPARRRPVRMAFRYSDRRTRALATGTSPQPTPPNRRSAAPSVASTSADPRQVAIVARDLIVATRIADAAEAAGYLAARVDEPGRLPSSSGVAVAFVDWADREPGWGAKLRGWQAEADSPRAAADGVTEEAPGASREDA